MQSQPTEEKDTQDDQGEGTPVCIKCFTGQSACQLLLELWWCHRQLYTLLTFYKHSLASECLGPGLASNMVSGCFYTWPSIQIHHDSVECALYVDWFVF